MPLPFLLGYAGWSIGTALFGMTAAATTAVVSVSQEDKRATEARLAVLEAINAHDGRLAGERLRALIPDSVLHVAAEEAEVTVEDLLVLDADGVAYATVLVSVLRLEEALARAIISMMENDERFAADVADIVKAVVKRTKDAKG